MRWPGHACHLHSARHIQRVFITFAAARQHPIMSSNRHYATRSPVIHILQRKPSFAIQAYLLTAEVPFTVENIYYSDALSSGPFPQLRHGSKVSSRVRIVAAEDILSYIRDNVHDIDKNLTKDQQVLNRLICTTVVKKLDVFLLYSHWIGWCFRQNDDNKFLTETEEIFKNSMRIECKVHHLSYLTSLIVPSAKVLSQVLPAQLSPSVFYDLKESWNKFQANNMLHRSLESVLNETETEYAMLESLLDESSTAYFHSQEHPSTGDVVVFEHIANADMKEYPYMEMRSKRSIQIYGDYTPKFMDCIFHKMAVFEAMLLLTRKTDSTLLMLTTQKCS